MRFLVNYDSATSSQRLHRSFHIGVVIRGDEWSGEKSPSNVAVLNALFSLNMVFSSSALILLVDHIDNCVSRPAYLHGSTCVSTSSCLDPVYRMPTMNCIFGVLLQSTPATLDSDIVGFINGDILVFNNFLESIAFLADNLERFLMVGRRSNIETPPLLTKHQWKALEKVYHSRSAPLDGGYAIDYFIMTKKDFSQFQQAFPPFIIGTQRWDNALLAMAFKTSGIAVIDATHSSPVLHQGLNQIPNHGDRPAARFNEDIATHSTGYDYLYGTIDNAEVLLQSVQGELQLIPKTPKLRLWRCAFISGTLVPEGILPQKVETWLYRTIKRAPQNVMVEVQVDDGMKQTIVSSPFFQKFSSGAENIYVTLDTGFHYMIFTPFRSSLICPTETSSLRQNYY